MKYFIVLFLTSLTCDNSPSSLYSYSTIAIPFSFTYVDTKQVKYVESANGTKYNFIYDSFGRLTKISVNGEIINQFSYNETINTINKGLVSRKQYGSNGDYFDFIYNEEDQIEEVKQNEER